MDNSKEWKDLGVRLKVFTKWTISGLIDSAFLALWVLIQWFVNDKVIANLKLSGVDKWVLLIFQIIFAISTLAPVIVYTYTDIRLMIIQAQKRIRRERKSA